MKACLEAALPGIDVQQHDDGTKPRMHDLDLVQGGERFGAVEVTAAADADSIELWKVFTRRGRWVEPQLVGGWVVHLRPSARAKRVRAEVPSLLAGLQTAGIREIQSTAHPQTTSEIAADRLGLVYAWHGDAKISGTIFLNVEQPPEKTTGMVADTGDALADWLGGWLLGADQADNLAKLSNSGASERHIFVIFPTYSTAPFDVSDLLNRTAAPIPTSPPQLPPAVTHVWAMSTWNTGDGIRWSPDTVWSRFAKVAPGP